MVVLKMNRLQMPTPVSVLLLVAAAINALTAQAQLVSNFYNAKCPNAENLITIAVQNAFNSNRASMPGVLRMHFHDCFVHGCDGSVLIDSPSEKDAIPNQTLHGFEVIDAAKTSVEQACPGVVSCADILALSAEIAVKQLSGGRINWKVPTGRRDGTVSSASDANNGLPSPLFTVAQLTSLFAAVGLSQDQMVTLSGAHSVGVAHCNAFSNRLTTPADPTLDPTYATILKNECPSGSTNTVSLDPTTPNTLDEVYYRNLQAKKGLLTSDENLENDAGTQPIVNENASSGRFGQKFSNAMLAMSSINVLTGTQGQIRLNCRKFN